MANKKRKLEGEIKKLKKDIRRERLVMIGLPLGVAGATYVMVGLAPSRMEQILPMGYASLYGAGQLSLTEMEMKKLKEKELKEKKKELKRLM